jgi:hypothetical protein
VTVVGLGADLTVVRSIAARLVAPSTMSALVVSLNDPSIVGADATPASVTVVLTLTVTIPPLLASGGMLASLNAAMGTSLAAALASAGYTVTSATSFVLAPPAPVSAALPPPDAASISAQSSPAVVSRRTVALSAVFSTVGLILLGLAVWFGVRRTAARNAERAAVRRTRASLIGKTLSSDPADEEEPDTPSPREGLADVLTGVADFAQPQKVAGFAQQKSALDVASRGMSRTELIADATRAASTPKAQRRALDESQPTPRAQDLPLQPAAAARPPAATPASVVQSRAVSAPRNSARASRAGEPQPLAPRLSAQEVFRLSTSDAAGGLRRSAGEGAAPHASRTSVPTRTVEWPPRASTLSLSPPRTSTARLSQPSQYPPRALPADR